MIWSGHCKSCKKLGPICDHSLCKTCADLKCMCHYPKDIKQMGNNLVERFVHIERSGFEKIKDPNTQAWNIHMTMDDSNEIAEKPNAKIVWTDSPTDELRPVTIHGPHGMKRHHCKECYAIVHENPDTGEYNCPNCPKRGAIKDLEMKPAPNYMVQSEQAGRDLFKPYRTEDLHGKTGTIYIGVDEATYGRDGSVKTVMFVEKETGKAYVIATEHEMRNLFSAVFDFTSTWFLIITLVAFVAITFVVE